MDIVYLIGSIAGGLILAYIGALIGSMKGHTTIGFFLGLLLGPIGLIIIAMHQDDRFKCPACGGSIVPGKPRCKNCGAQLAARTPVPRVRAPRKALTAIILAVICAGSQAQEPPPTPTVVQLTARRLVNKKTSKSNWRSRDGSYDKSATHSISVEVMARNLGKERQEYHAVISFLAVPSSGKNTTKNYMVFDSTEMKFALDPMQSDTQIVESREIGSTHVNFSGSDVSWRSGQEMAGWAVWLFHGDELINVAASTKAAEIVARQNGVSAWPKMELQ